MSRKDKPMVIRSAIGICAICLFAFLPFHAVTAQTVKSVGISHEESFTDHLALKNDSKDMDLMVKFVFNEEQNTLTVSLISYRTLFVLWDSVRYKSAVKCRWIRPEQLPYVASSNPGDRFRLSKDYCKTLSVPNKKHVFKKWIEVEGLQPAEQELKMVNDYIEQTFDIPNKRNNVVVRLRDLMLMDLKRQKTKGNYYEITYGKDLQQEYQITLQRNPCFGLDDEVGAANNALEAIRKSYQSLKTKYGKKKVANQEALNIFTELKETLVAQFPKNNDSSPCPHIQQARIQYNLIADSIRHLNVTLEASASDAMAAIGGAEGRALNARSILANARLLDSTVSRWLVCRDETEREDLVTQCRNIIKETSLMIGNGHGSTLEERNAVKLFRQAEQFFKRTCK